MTPRSIDLDAVSERMKSLRARLALTQAEVAGEIGIAKRTFQSWENGEAQTEIENYERIAAFYTEELGETITGHELMHGEPPTMDGSPGMGRATIRESAIRDRDSLVDFIEQEINRRFAALRIQLLAELPPERVPKDGAPRLRATAAERVRSSGSEGSSGA